MTIQIFIPFMVAGVGTIGAGIVLGKVEVSKFDLLNFYYIYYNKGKYRKKSLYI